MRYEYKCPKCDAVTEFATRPDRWYCERIVIPDEHSPELCDTLMDLIGEVTVTRPILIGQFPKSPEELEQEKREQS